MSTIFHTSEAFIRELFYKGIITADTVTFIKSFTSFKETQIQNLDYLGFIYARSAKITYSTTKSLPTHYFQS